MSAVDIIEKLDKENKVLKERLLVRYDECIKLQKEKETKSPCVWKEEKDIDTCYVYASGCDNPFEFVDGNPKDNNFKFCPFCGGEIE